MLWLNPDEEVPAVSHARVRDALVRSDAIPSLCPPPDVNVHLSEHNMGGGKARV